MQPRLAVRADHERPGKSAMIECCSLLNSLLPAHRAKVLEESFAAFAARGETIWLPGWPAEYVGIVGDGFVKMTKSTPRGVEAVVEILGPGQVFGLLVAIEGRTYPLSAVAATDTWYLKIPGRTLLALYEESPQFKDHIVRYLAPRLRKAHDMMGHLSSGRVECRLAAVLMILADTYGEAAPCGIRLGVPLTRQDLAEMSGTTVETAIRIMSRWQREGVTSTDHQFITIRDAATLLAAMNG